MLKRGYLLFIVVITLSLVGCGDDNGTGPGQEEPPPLPEMQNTRPDLSFFDSNSPTNEDTSYAKAQMQALSANFFLSLGQVYSGYLQAARGENASFDDGVWNWTYNDSYNGMSMEIEVTAQEQDNETEWAMLWTMNDGEGNSFEDYRIMEGVVQNDGSEGSWTFNILNDNDEITPAYTSSWSIISDTEETITLEIYDEENAPSTIVYEKNEPEFNLVYNFSDEEDVEIVWNSETGTGSLMQGNTQQCWDENLQDIACP